jgi:hypothetical protein
LGRFGLGRDPMMDNCPQWAALWLRAKPREPAIGRTK